MNWNDDLEGQALRIAEADHSPFRVLAGPGTGKTFALMRRVARLLQNGSDPERILMSTFTRTAASDLKKSLRNLGIEGVNEVPAGTLHAFCFGLLSKAEVFQITGRVPRPLLKFEERFLLEDLQDGNTGGIRECDRMLRAFNAAWARDQFDRPGWPDDRLDHQFHHKLLRWVRFHRAMLIGELIPETLHYLRENPTCDALQAYEHVLVDEYQDLNRAEQALLDLLARAGTLAVIGDEDQSIYSFKYAHPEGIAQFEVYHPGTHDETLDDCRRCSQLVVELANQLISNNIGRAPRLLRPLATNPEGEVFVVQWTSLEEEANGIAKFIKGRITSESVSAGKVLVLSPRRQMGYAIREALVNLETPAHSFFHEEALDGNPKTLEGCPDLQAFTLLTLLANPEDRVALRCWCGFGSNSLRSNAWKRLQEHCEESNLSPRSMLERILSGKSRIPHTGEIVRRYSELNRKLQTLQGLRGRDLVDAIFPSSAQWATPFRYIGTLFVGDDSDAEALQDALRTGITQPELPTDVDYVRIMSLHKSKGLTADLVVVVGCIDGLIPMVRQTDSIEEQQRSIEEQRRLFYVAITRTTHSLVVSSVSKLETQLAYQMRVPVVGRNNGNANTIASRYLRELGPSKPTTVTGQNFLRITGGY